MTWKEFIVQMTTQIAWPATVLISLVLLKDKVNDILPRIEKFKHKDTEIAFSKAMNEVVEKAAEIEEEGKSIPDDLEAEEKRLLDYIDFSPNSVIHQAYALLDRELLALYNNTLEGEARRPLKVKDARIIREQLGFDQELEVEIKKIRNIRTMIMKNRQHLISQEQAASYVELCTDVVAKIREIAANKQRQSDA